MSFPTGVWASALPLQERAQALDAALRIANTLRDPSDVESLALNNTAQLNHIQWSGHTLSAGFAGTALLFGHFDRCFPEEGWDIVAHDHLTSAVSELACIENISPGLFGGISGVCFVANYLSRDGTRYNNLLSKLDSELERALKPLLVYFDSEPCGIPTHTFDVISGIAGCVPYLTEPRANARNRHLFDKIIRALIQLSNWSDLSLPRWHVPQRLLNPLDSMSTRFPHGFLNCGLAHGIPGVLAALAQASANGQHADGLNEAIASLAGWICEHRHDDEWGLNWPSGVDVRSAEMGKSQLSAVAVPPPAQAGWCYGSPGVASALRLAGRSIADSAIEAFADRALDAVLLRPWPKRGIPSPTFCHGISGLLQITARFNARSPKIEAKSNIVDIFQVLIKRYSPETPLGFSTVGLDNLEFESPAFLDGAAGVALVLLSMATDQEPEWDRIFMLS